MTIIAIDGPAGSGKTTVARALAVRLGVPHVDTGAYYRAVTLACLEQGVDVADADALAALTARLDIRQDAGRTLLDGRDVSDDIRTASVDGAVSAVAGHQTVRTLLVERQRAAVTTAGGVVEGRDAGTRIVPGADLKIWLTAAPETRASRRAGDVAGDDRRGVDAALIAQQASALAERDRRDRANMQQAPDVRTIDSSTLTVDEVVDRVVELLGTRP